MLLPVAYASQLTLGLPAILISQLIKPKVYQYQSFWCVFEGQNMNNFCPDCLEVPKTEWFKPRDILVLYLRKLFRIAQVAISWVKTSFRSMF